MSRPRTTSPAAGQKARATSGRLTRSDRAALKRILARYEGASYSPSRSYLPGSVQSARFDASKATRLELVRRSRYWERNSALYNRLADLFETYTVGAQVQLQPMSSDAEWNDLAKPLWQTWCQFPDLTSRQGFGTLMSQAARAWFVDGEIFIALVRGPSGRPRLQLLESHLIATPPHLRHLEGREIVDGVQVDANGRPTAYWMAQESGGDNAPGGLFGLPAQPALEWIPLDADWVIHLFEPSRPGQMRGLPFCYPVLNDLNDLADLQELEQKAARDAAEITNVLLKEGGEMSDEDAMRMAAQLAQQDRDATGQAAATHNEDRTTWLRESVGGRAIALDLGEKIEQFKSERPSVATKEYWRHLAEKVCMGIGIPYVMAVPELMQGTVYRGAMDGAASWFLCRSVVTGDAVRRCYAYVMGYHQRPGGEIRRGPQDWYQATVYPPRAANFDIGRNSAAAIAELAAGLTDYDQWYGRQGQDYRERFLALREQRTFAQSIGLDLGENSPPPIGEATPTPEDALPSTDNPASLE